MALLGAGLRDEAQQCAHIRRQMRNQTFPGHSWGCHVTATALNENTQVHRVRANTVCDTREY